MPPLRMQTQRMGALYGATSVLHETNEHCDSAVTSEAATTAVWVCCVHADTENGRSIWCKKCVSRNEWIQHNIIDGAAGCAARVHCAHARACWQLQVSVLPRRSAAVQVWYYSPDVGMCLLYLICKNDCAGVSHCTTVWACEQLKICVADACRHHEHTTKESPCFQQ